MSVLFGLGFVDFNLDADATTDQKLDAVRALADAAKVRVRDAFDGRAFCVEPDGTATELHGDEARALLDAVASSSGQASYAAFSHLDGFVVCVDGAQETEFELPYQHGDSYVGPLASLEDTLDGLLHSRDVEPESTSLHRTLRALCERARALGLPLTTGT